MITKITGKNQVTVPASIVAEAGLRPGTRLDWEVAEDGVLVVRVLPDRGTLATSLRGAGRSHLKDPCDVVESLTEERAVDEQERA